MMKPKLTEVKISALVEGYKNNETDGVIGFSGKLDIRPPYQRNFIYKGKQRDAVIDTVIKGFPLNVMYWGVRKDGKFEMIDGQQRTISIAEYKNGDFSVNGRFFYNLQQDEKDKFLNYPLMVYQCKGTDSEKLDWFKTINIAGEALSNQELRNAIYSGPWVSAAKIYFSKSGCPAYDIGKKYLSGDLDRQTYLETTIKWISNAKTERDIEKYMGKHQLDTDVVELWEYFENVINWIEATFPKYRKEMQGIQWGTLYNEFKIKKLDSAKLGAEVARLMEDEDVSNKKGIYTYLLTGEEKHLNIRVFNENQRREAFERQKGVCVKCGKEFKFDEMHADHIKPWSKGGKTEPKNCQMLCQKDNAIKSNK